jgi:hypothetical protein
MGGNNTFSRQCRVVLICKRLSNCYDLMMVSLLFVTTHEGFRELWSIKITRDEYTEPHRSCLAAFWLLYLDFALGFFFFTCFYNHHQQLDQHFESDFFFQEKGNQKQALSRKGNRARIGVFLRYILMCMCVHDDL